MPTGILSLAPSPFVIFQGDAKTMACTLVSADAGGNQSPADLTNCSAITVSIPGAAGAPIVFSLTSGVTITSPLNLGNFSVAIPSSQSALFNTGELQNFDVTFTIGTVVETVRYVQGISVYEVISN